MTSPIKSGTWLSKGGSCLVFHIGDNGQLSGYYSTVHGRTEKGETFPITGFVNNEMIGFVCSWGKYTSVSTWCGRWKPEDGQDCLHVVWHLGRQFADEALTIPNELTFTFHTNAGKFYWHNDQTP